MTAEGSAESAPPSLLPVLALGLAAFLANFDITAVVMALPAIAREIDLGISGYAWTMDAYSLTFTGSLLVAGALADRYGRRRSMLCGNVVFAIASLGCGFAWNGPSLWAARAVQGIGAAFLVTAGIALIASAYPSPAARTRAFAWLGVMSGIAMALGPTIGGLVSAWVGWRWIFLINLLACAILAWGVPRLIGEERAASPRKLDFAGMVLLTAALCAVIEALLLGRSSTATSAGGLAAGLLLIALFVAQQRRREQAIFDPAVFAQPAVVGVGVLLFAVSVGFWAILVYLPLFLTGVFGWSSRTIGVALLCATFPMLVVPPLGGRLVNRVGWRWCFAIALVLVAMGNASLMVAAGGSAHQFAQIVFGMVAIGVGAALAHPQLSGAVVALVPAEMASMASAVTVVVRQAGFALGIAVLGMLLDPANPTGGFSWLFAAATVASLGGVAGGLLLLPRQAAGQSIGG
jgi:MFS family permease